MSSGVEGMRELTERHALDILEGVLVGHAIGGGDVPDWIPLSDVAQAAVNDGMRRDADKTANITRYLRPFGLEWSGPDDGRVVKAVGTEVIRLCERVRLRDRFAALERTKRERAVYPAEYVAACREQDRIREQIEGVRGGAVESVGSVPRSEAT